MRLRFVVLAEKVILDFERMTPSVINIIDDLEMTIRDNENNLVPDLEVLPIQLSLLATWEFEEGDSRVAEQFQVHFGFPDGDSLALVEPTVIFGEKRRFHARVNLNGIHYRGPGDYEVIIRREGIAEPVGRWPIYIAINENPE